MGFSLSWAAVQGVAREEVLARLDLRDTGEDDSYYETPFAGGVSPGNWTIIVSNDFEQFRQEEALALLSVGARVIAACAEEHVMFSSAEEWTNGVRLWMVEHQGEGGDPTHLVARGNAPPSLPSIRDDMMQKQSGQSDVDFGFEIPLLLARGIVGFKHDDGGDDHAFTRLESLSAPAQKPEPEPTAGPIQKKRGFFSWLK